jgi:hypothetical protein
MSHDVFISYVVRDKSVAEAVLAGLERRGVRCWIAPRDVRPGEDWSGSIIQAITDARVLIVLFSAQSGSSTQLIREVELAASRGLPIVPFRLENAAPSASLQYFLGRVQWIDATAGQLDAHIERLAHAVSGVLQQQGPVGAAPAPVAPPSTSDARATARSAGWIEQLKGVFRRRPAPAQPREPAARAQSSAIAATLTEAMAASAMRDIPLRRLRSQWRGPLSALDSSLPGTFDRISLQAEQILSLQDSGRRLESIDEALRSLSEVRSALVGRPGALADALGDVAAQWTQVFAAERARTLTALDQSSEIENPFIFGNPVRAGSDGLFTGRRDIALEIERNVLRSAQTPTLLLYGQRRVGKTSILYQLPALLGPEFLPVVVDCQAPAMVESEAALLRYLSRHLAGALNARLQIGGESAAEQAARGALPLPIDVLSREPFSVFDDWLDAYLSHLPADCRLLLCVDEFERLQEAVTASWGARFLDALRHWVQHRPQFALMFVGSHTFEQLGPLWTDRFLSARRLKVGFLAPGEVRQLLTRPTPTFRMTYAPGAVEAILDATRGQPFLTQALAYELVQHLNRVHRRQARPDDVEAAIADMLERSAEYFADVWASRSDAERAILLDVARGRRHPPVTAEARGLREYDLLDDQGGFAVPLVERWIKANQRLGA